MLPMTIGSSSKNPIKAFVLLVLLFILYFVLGYNTNIGFGSSPNNPFEVIILLVIFYYILLFPFLLVFLIPFLLSLYIFSKKSKKSLRILLLLSSLIGLSLSYPIYILFSLVFY